MEIRPISLQESLPARSLALRWGQPFDKCIIPEDSNPDAFHIGAIVAGKVVGTASFFPNNLEEYGENGYQLRMMGVMPEYQGLRCGKEIVIYALEILKTNHQAAYLWCKAREAAYLFYEKMGFEFISDEFEIPLIGTHRTMLLRL